MADIIQDENIEQRAAAQAKEIARKKWATYYNKYLAEHRDEINAKRRARYNPEKQKEYMKRYWEKKLQNEKKDGDQ